MGVSFRITVSNEPLVFLSLTLLQTYSVVEELLIFECHFSSVFPSHDLDS